VVDSILKSGFWLRKNGLDPKNADLWKRLLVIYRHQVDFKWIKGHNNHPNERCDVLAVITQSIPLSIDAFMRREEGKF
jgi:ribonuclease HI